MERLEAVMTSPVCVEWDELKKTAKSQHLSEINLR